MESLNAQLLEQFEEYSANHDKFTAGNAAAGTRARKALMEISKLCKDRRKEIQESKNA